MGASSWNYFVPYRADAAEALSELRWTIFRKLTTKKPHAEKKPAPTKKAPPPITFEEFLPPGVEDDFEDFPDEEASWREMYEREVLGMKSTKAPTSPDEFLEDAGEDGTHTAIDVTTLPASAWLDEKELRSLFGTTEPTRAAVEAKLLDLANIRERGECSVVVVYSRGEPKELCFSGRTGD